MSNILKFRKIEGLIFFDIDNILFDSNSFNLFKIEKLYEQLLLTKPNLKISKQDFFNLYILVDKQKNNSTSLIYNVLSQIPEIENIFFLEELLIKKEKELLKKYSSKYLFDGVIDLFKVLKKENFKLGIITQGNKEYQKNKLIFLDIYKYFNEDLIFIIDNRIKDSFCYSLILSSIRKKFKTKNLWMIGDKEDKDIIPAKEANFKTMRIFQTTQKTQEIFTSANYSYLSIKQVNYKVFLLFPNLEILINTHLNQFKEKEQIKNILLLKGLIDSYDIRNLLIVSNSLLKKYSKKYPLDEEILFKKVLNEILSKIKEI